MPIIWMLICLRLSIGLLKCSLFLLDFLLATLVISIIIHSYVLFGVLFTFCVSHISYCILQLWLCFFFFSFFFLFSSSLLEFSWCFFSCLFFSSSVSIIITNSSESLPSTLYTSVFWLFCQRLSRSLSMETSPTVFPFFSVQFSCSAMSNAMQPHDCSMPGLTVHHQLPEFTQTRVHWVCDDTQPSYSVVLVSSCLQSFPASGCFQMSQFFTSGGQSVRVSTSASVLPIFFFLPLWI